jgi:hypothetical protein
VGSAGVVSGSVGALVGVVERAAVGEAAIVGSGGGVEDGKLTAMGVAIVWGAWVELLQALASSAITIIKNTA